MELTSTKTPIVEKMEELCQTLLDQPVFKNLKASLDTFMQDEGAQSQYQGLLEKQDLLQGKQQRGISLSPEEIDDFQKERDALLDNEVAKGFLDAQESIQELHDTLNRYLSKTIELGRVPEEDEVKKSGGCCGGGGGGGCGCSH